MRPIVKMYRSMRGDGGETYGAMTISNVMILIVDGCPLEVSKYAYVFLDRKVSHGGSRYEFLFVRDGAHGFRQRFPLMR